MCFDFHACRRVGHGTGTPGRARTCNPRLRRPMLYPVELRAQLASTPPMDRRISSPCSTRKRETSALFVMAMFRRGRGREIRTPDFLLPKQARCQTAPYPAIRLSVAPLSARIILAAIWAVKRDGTGPGEAPTRPGVDGFWRIVHCGIPHHVVRCRTWPR